MIKIFVLGDVVAKAGRRALDSFLHKAIAKYSPDIIGLNGENLAGGFGLSRKIFDSLKRQFPIDFITLGNHWHRHRDIFHFGFENKHVVFPGNSWNLKSRKVYGKKIKNQNGIEFGVVNVLGNVFMSPENGNAIEYIQDCLDRLDTKINILDFHGEATSEKQAIARIFADKFVLIYGTHSHVPTMDHRIIAGRCGYISDLGMTGAYDSVIGMDISAAMSKFSGDGSSKYHPAENNLAMMGVIAEVDTSRQECISLKRLVFSENGEYEYPTFI